MKKIACFSEIKRLKNVIESDRMSFTSDSMNVISYDLQQVLQNYFLLCGKPRVRVEKNGVGYTVIIEARADAIRPFGILPQ